MEDNNTCYDSYFNGYKSPQAKRDFTTQTVIVTVLFFLLQFIVPFISLFLFMPTFFFSSFTKMKIAQPDNGVYWKEALWYPVQTSAPGTDRYQVVHMVPGAGEGKQDDNDQVYVSLSNPCFLADKEKIWIISSDGVGEYRDGQYKPLSGVKLGAITCPFYYKGNPAVIQETPSGLFLMTFQQGKWNQEMEITLGKPAKPDLDDEKTGSRRKSYVLSTSRVENIQVLSFNDRILFFYKLSGRLYYREGFPEKADEDPSTWQVIGKTGSQWRAVAFPGYPAMFYTTVSSSEKSVFSMKIVGKKLEGNDWKEFFSHPVGVLIDAGVFPTEKEGNFYILAQGFPGQIRLMEVVNGSVAEDKKSGMPFPFSMMPISTIIIINLIMWGLLLIYVLVVSSLMNRYQDLYFREEIGEWAYAPLWKRGIARGVDMLIGGFPLVIIWYYSFTHFFDFSEMFPPMAMFRTFGLILLGLIWMLLAGLVFSFMEGTTGKSPGKMLMKIRVVGINNQLRPCGFGLGVLRNLLLAVDTIYNFLVGILMIAFTEKHQRIGDMAAKTVVLEDSPI